MLWHGAPFMTVKEAVRHVLKECRAVADCDSCVEAAQVMAKELEPLYGN